MSSLLHQPLLSIIGVLAFGLALVVALPVRPEDDSRMLPRYIALIVSLTVLIIGLFACLVFDKSSVGFQFLYRYDLLPEYNLSFTLGADGLSMTFIMLTLFIFPISILAA